MFGSWFDHVKSWINAEEKESILYIFYEEMIAVSRTEHAVHYFIFTTSAAEYVSNLEITVNNVGKPRGLAHERNSCASGQCFPPFHPEVSPVLYLHIRKSASLLSLIHFGNTLLKAFMYNAV